MVTEGFHDFFLGVAGVAGALIGLLFVAISVNPGEAAKGPISQRIRPASALSAFLNPLFVSLVALLPLRDPSGPFKFLTGAASLAAVGLVAFVLRENWGRPFRSYARLFLSLLVQLATCVLQLIAVLEFAGDPENTDWLLVVCFTVIVFFAMGIGRAWDFVGAQSTSVFDAIASALVHARRDPDGSERDGGD